MWIKLPLIFFSFEPHNASRFLAALLFRTPSPQISMILLFNLNLMHMVYLYIYIIFINSSIFNNILAHNLFVS